MYPLLISSWQMRLYEQPLNLELLSKIIVYREPHLIAYTYELKLELKF